MIGEKINLRPICMDDVYILNKWKNDEETYKFLGGGYQPISRDQYEKWAENMIDLTGNNRRFIIENKDFKPIGMIGLYGINWIHGTCETGAFIGEKQEKGKGFASEAYKILEKYASSYLNLRKISLKVVSENSAKNFWLSLGYTVVGKLNKDRYIDGKYCDVLIMEKFIQS